MLREDSTPCVVLDCTVCDVWCSGFSVNSAFYVRTARPLYETIVQDRATYVGLVVIEGRVSRVIAERDISPAVSFGRRIHGTRREPNHILWSASGD